MVIRVLLVEDEPLLAIDLASDLSRAGFDVIGPANCVARALHLITARGCDVALLDVNLGTETSEAVARVLRSIGTPFLVMSGYAEDELPAGFDGAPFLAKPVDPAYLSMALKTAIAEMSRC